MDAAIPVTEISRFHENPRQAPVVFVVDDDVSVCESLELLIRHEGWQSETFDSAQQFLARPRCTAPCCLVLDVSLPGLNGLELQTQLRDRTNMPIIFITGHGNVRMTVQAMKAGAVEFLTKPIREQDLVDAVQVALQRDQIRRESEAELSGVRAKLDSLTPREREVLVLVTSGLMNKQIAADLGISEIMVKVHRGNVMRKMSAASLADLVVMAQDLGIRGSKK